MPRIEERRRECASGGKEDPGAVRCRGVLPESGIAVSRANRPSSASRSDRRVAYARIDFQSPPSDAGGNPTRRLPTPPTPRSGPARSSYSRAARVGMRSVESLPGVRETPTDPPRPAQASTCPEGGKDPPEFEEDRQKAGGVRELGNGNRQQAAGDSPAGSGLPERHHAGGLGSDRVPRTGIPSKDDLVADRHVTFPRGSPRG